MSAQSGNLEGTENYIYSIWKFGGNGELYPLNLEIWRRWRTISAQSRNLEATENYIRSI